MAFSLDDIKKFAANPKSIPAQGSYGEGLLYNIGDMAQTLKSSVQSGDLSLTDYQSLIDPLMKTAVSFRNSQNLSGSRGNAIAGGFNPLVDNGFLQNKGGQFTTGLGFSQSDYAKLPDNVLPTQTDVQKGLFDPNLAPTQRFQTGNGGSTNQPATGVTPTPVNGPNGQPLPQINPSLPPGVDTTTDQGKTALQGANNASQLQDALNKQLQVNQQAVGQLGQTLAGIPDVFRQEGTSEQQQLQALADQQKSSRAQSLTDLGSVLAQNQQNLFNRAIPDLAEQANTAGIYRSTGFGNILAQKYAGLTQDTQTQLAMQGLSDREAYLQAQSGALNQNLGFQGQAAQAQASGLQTTGAAGAGALQAYGAGLGDVANAQIGMQNAGLQRQFSLQDYATQYQNALQLANQARVSQPSTGKAQNAAMVSAVANPAAAVYGAKGGKGASGTPSPSAFTGGV